MRRRGGLLNASATPSLLDEVQQILSILELEGTHEGCGTLLLPKLVVRTVVRTVVLREMFLKPPYFYYIISEWLSINEYEYY